ncbi:hypothetical protein MKW98_001186 [Papaver atlanticum]|uniref:Uncharacterized protein n=1 Tax=Papaver atlanticum TaxID=357466 RepID=A0AAD4SRL4_9MAGN|nr:hypothetical protein MKW98_001186 [Papaver atlanticum]
MVSNNGHQSYSTFECLLSHVWKIVTQVRGLDPEETSQVRISVNGRPRISEPAVNMEYFGNLVLWAYPRLEVRELLNESYADIARVIHHEVNRVNNRYFKSFIDFGATIDQEGGNGNKTDELQQTTPEFGSTLCPDLEVDSWLRFRFHDIDFGGGSPCRVIPPNSPFEGLVVFIPAGAEDGGVDVKLTLFAEHVPLFKKIAHSIDSNIYPSKIGIYE